MFHLIFRFFNHSLATWTCRPNVHSSFICFILNTLGLGDSTFRFLHVFYLLQGLDKYKNLYTESFVSKVKTLKMTKTIAYWKLIIGKTKSNEYTLYFLGILLLLINHFYHSFSWESWLKCMLSYWSDILLPILNLNDFEQLGIVICCFEHIILEKMKNVKNKHEQQN